MPPRRSQPAPPSRTRTDARRPRTASRRRALHPRRQRGVVLVITLLASIFLAALVFYVFNLGQGTQSRIETQHAADAAATAGAGWVARSMNTVAMNNIAMTRQLALVNVLDALPRTVAHTRTDQQAMLDAVRAQLARGTGPEPWVRDELERVEQRLAEQVGMLEAVDDALNGPDGYDVRELTFYQTPTGQRGRLWQAMQAMDALNQATLASIDTVAAAAARHGARANLSVQPDPTDDADEPVTRTALLLRGQTPFRAQRGRFEDFQGPLTTGLTRRAEDTAAADDWHHHRGPFDAVFGWRTIQWDIERGDPPDHGISDGFSSGWSGGGERPAGPIISREPISFTPYGMHEWLTRRFHWLNYRPSDTLSPNRLGSRGPLRYSGFNRHLAEIADIKFGYSPFKEQIGRRVVQPRWVDFDTARQLIQAREEADDDERQQLPEIHEFRFIELVYTQRRAVGGGAIEEPRLQRWSINIRPGLEPPGLTRQRRYMWRDQQIERPAALLEQGMERRRLYYYIFAGANIGQRVSVRNPYNFSNWEDLPAPVDFDLRDDADQPDLLPDGGFTFLAVARQPRLSPMWSRAFDRELPQRQQLAIAEAHVFNNHSWDLWTQMWHAQLQPVGGFEHWLAELEAAPFDVLFDPTGPRRREAEEIHRQLHSMRELAPLLLNH